MLFLGSSCIFLTFAPQPMREEHLLTGELEPTRMVRCGQDRGYQDVSGVSNKAEIINVGSGQEVTIAEIAALVGDIVGFHEKVLYNKEMSDGTPRKLLDVSKRSALGWKSQVALREGVSATYSWFLNNESAVGI
ncbi:MAG: hypothetical protein D3925_07055 [Candidatus Electrothrix sp. AR5]|nr:hypothetical protein [Candidatus Electrothrix sp. AR5]